MRFVGFRRISTVISTVRESSCRAGRATGVRVLDLTTVRSWLPMPERRGEMVVPAPEEVFIAALQHTPSGPVRFSHGQPNDSVTSTVRTVAMLPMN